MQSSISQRDKDMWSDHLEGKRRLTAEQQQAQDLQIEMHLPTELVAARLPAYSTLGGTQNASERFIHERQYMGNVPRQILMSTPLRHAHDFYVNQ